MMARRLAGMAAAVAGLLLGPGAAWAAGGGCVSDGSCNAGAPSCAQQVTYGTDNCGTPCYKVFDNQCSILPPTCDAPHSEGTYTCGEPCSWDFYNECNAASPGCEQTTYGTYTCGGVCSYTGGSCDTGPGESWSPYGYAQPGHPKNGFGLPSNNTRTMLGLAAKGNIVLGDYTSQKFQDYVVPLFGGGDDGVTMPYVIDPTDDSLGYHDDGNDVNGKPKFSGNYNQNDGGYKLNPDGTVAEDGNGNGLTRKFYESSLTDAEFQSLLDPNWDPESGAGGQGGINATLFTNHALMGYSPRDGLGIYGSLVARDDTLVYNTTLGIEHDPRLTTGGQNQATDIALPFSIKRPSLCSRIACPASGCVSTTPACP